MKTADIINLAILAAQGIESAIKVGAATQKLISESEIQPVEKEMLIKQIKDAQASVPEWK